MGLAFLRTSCNVEICVDMEDVFANFHKLERKSVTYAVVKAGARLGREFCEMIDENIEHSSSGPKCIY